MEGSREMEIRCGEKGNVGMGFWEREEARVETTA